MTINQVHQFLINTYKKTQWPTFTVIGLKLAFGPTTLVQLNELRKKGIVRKRQGINGDLVELLITE